MTTDTATKACATCVHYNASTGDQGECRRHAPQTVVFQVDADTKFESRFPTVAADAWCGDYSAS